MIIVMGPSNSGKSTYLQNLGVENKTGYTFEKIGSEIEYFHYNILKKAFNQHIGRYPKDELDVSNEKTLLSTFENSNIEKAIVLVCPIKDLISRANNRDFVENRLQNHKYDRDLWVRLLSEFDLFMAYEQIFDFLDRRNVDYTVYYSDNSYDIGTFKPSDRVYVNKNLRGTHITVPSNEQVKEIIEKNTNNYQSTLLPLGLTTGSSGFKHVSGGRLATFKALTDRSFVNRSVLDIGCANGDFLFRAERLGAVPLVGLELKRARFDAAERIGRLLRSSVEFYNIDFFKYNSTETYDDVLILNVIHHVSDFRRMIQKATGMARERIIIEYPTIKDERYQSLSEVDFGISQYPVVGVSSESVQQTFVFTAVAIQRIVAEVGDFHSILYPSPISGREILVFERSPK